MDFATRRNKLRKLLKKSGAEALLVTSVPNVTYLTGFTGDSSYLLITQENELLVSDGRFLTQIEEECPGLDMNIRRPGILIHQQVAKILRGSGFSRLAIEADSMTVATRKRIAAKVPKLQIGSTSGMVEQLRQVKDKDEIALIRQAIRIAEKSFAVLRAGLRPEQTEMQIGDALEHQIRLFGGDGPAFAPIVAVGPRAALPHAKLSDCRVADGDMLLVDWGAQFRLYKSDLTRVLVTGRISPKLRRVYEVVLRAQARAIAAIRPGVPTAEVDAAAREVIAEARLNRRFNHGIGHGFGLEIHESPRMQPARRQEQGALRQLPGKNTATLKAGMVVTVEPGAYIPGLGGVRIEDDILVTRDGHEVLTSLPKQFEEMVVS
jgi:Xaa-Pro aminopeptidase